MTLSAPLLAQPTASLAGVVRNAGSPTSAVANAVVEIPTLGLRALTDSAGRFTIHGIQIGKHTVGVRAIGYDADSTAISFMDERLYEHSFTISSRVATLGEVRVVENATSLTSSRAIGFEERRRTGVGSFLDRAAIAEWDDRGNVSDILRRVPGLRVNASGSRAWVSSSRSSGTGQGVFSRARRQDALTPADQAAGAPLACYMDVYVDGVQLYNSAAFSAGAGSAASLFDINTIPPSTIEAIEVYSGPARMPAAFNRTSGNCGAVVIWTR